MNTPNADDAPELNDSGYYGPGKFEGEPSLTQTLYEASMISSEDDSCSYEDGAGWFGLFLDWELSNGAKISGILSESSQGFVSFSPYDNATDARAAWEKLKRDVEGYIVDDGTDNEGGT